MDIEVTYHRPRTGLLGLLRLTERITVKHEGADGTAIVGPFYTVQTQTKGDDGNTEVFYQLAAIELATVSRIAMTGRIQVARPSHDKALREIRPA